VIDHVNNLKLQYLVELSKLGGSCAGLERHVAEWLRDHDVVFNGATIPFVLMPHFISPAGRGASGSRSSSSAASTTASATRIRTTKPCATSSRTRRRTV
jgi:hypothetical protein